MRRRVARGEGERKRLKGEGNQAKPCRAGGVPGAWAQERAVVRVGRVDRAIDIVYGTPPHRPQTPCSSS